MKHILILYILIMFSFSANAQLYVEKQTRHRFAQMNVGIDIQRSFGGNTTFLNSDNQLQSLNLGSLARPRVIIGGTHFWGHADFFIAIPVVNPNFESDDQTIFFSNGVETGFKVFPWRIEHKKLRPYVGVSIAPYRYRQNNLLSGFPNGPGVNHTGYPVIAGLVYNSGSHILELNAGWNYNNNIDYYISRSTVTQVSTPPIYASIGYKYLFDTTVGAEESWESGATQLATKRLAAKGKLTGWTIGLGMSSSLGLGSSEYNANTRPYIFEKGISIFPDIAIGYHLFHPDMNINLAYRKYGKSTRTYGTVQRKNRRSIGLEIVKYVGDYHGFAPFIGPIVSSERLTFSETHEGENTQEISKDQIHMGLTFGWDIRPDRMQTMVLRTSLRYYPNLHINDLPEGAVTFTNLEFNFIQVVLYPGRMF